MSDPMKKIITAIFLLTASISFANESNSDSKTIGIGTHQGGRFAVVQISNFRRDQFLIDTHTGRLWSIVYDEKQQAKLQPIPYIGLGFGEERMLPEALTEIIKIDEASRKNAIDKFMKSLKSD